MRIAISGTHRAGKSTLVERLADALPGHIVVDEPYHLLEQEGHAFADMPSLEDFELQLERSLESLEGGGPDVIFDRCPVDLLAYVLTHEDAGSYDAEGWLPRIDAAMDGLDLVVFVPIEAPDVIAVADSEDAELRLEVDALLREMLVERAISVEVEVLEVSGTSDARFGQVLRHVRARDSR